MNTKENQRVRLTKRLFRESLISLLKKNQLYEITVSQLCEEAEMNRSTFYKHYSNVHDIYEEIESEVLQQSEKCIQGVQNIEEKYIIFQLEQLLNYIREHSDLYKLLLDNSADGDFPYKLIKPAMQFVTHKSELFPPYWKGKEEYCFIYVISGSLAMIRRWLSTGTKESSQEIAKMIYQIAKDCLNF